MIYKDFEVSDRGNFQAPAPPFILETKEKYEKLIRDSWKPC